MVAGEEFGFDVDFEVMGATYLTFETLEALLCSGGSTSILRFPGSADMEMWDSAAEGGQVQDRGGRGNGEKSENDKG